MTGKDQDNLNDAYTEMQQSKAAEKNEETVNEDVVPMKTGEDSLFTQAGAAASEPKTFGDSGPNAVDDLEEVKEEEDDKNSQSSEKIEEDTINNSNIMSKSTFDKLYEDVMGDENLALTREDDLDLGDDLGGDDMMNGDDEMNGEDVTVTLTSDQVDVLRDIMSQVDGDENGEDDLGDMGGEGDGMMDDELGLDSVQQEMQVNAEPKAVGNANHLASTASGGNKVGGSVTAKGGTAKHGSIKEEPVPRELGGGDRQHKDANNQGAWKVNNPGTPATGSSLFGN